MGTGRITLLAVATVAITGGLLLLYQLSGPPEVEGPAVEPEHEISDFELVETLESGNHWSLSSPQARRKSGEIRLESPQVHYFEDGDTLAVVEGREGVYDSENKVLVLEGEVRAVRLEPRQVLTTDYLQYDGSSGTIKTEARLQLEIKEGVLSGRGLAAELEEEIISLESDVKFRPH